MQKKAVKMIQGLEKVPYTEALKEFSLFKLSRRRLRSHLITPGNTFTRRNRWVTQAPLINRAKTDMVRTNCWKLERQANVNWKKQLLFPNYSSERTY